jgi:hypothetical protein
MFGRGNTLLANIAHLLRGMAMSTLGQTLQVAFSDAPGQVRHDLKADLIPMLLSAVPCSSVSVTEENDYAR